eukprot:1259036-Amphidinium_carterae.1
MQLGGACECFWLAYTGERAPPSEGLRPSYPAVATAPSMHFKCMLPQEPELTPQNDIWRLYAALACEDQEVKLTTLV